jgi:hypothetical protein
MAPDPSSTPPDADVWRARPGYDREALAAALRSCGVDP